MTRRHLRRVIPSGARDLAKCVAVATLVAACGGGGNGAKSPKGPRVDLAAAVVEATRLEAMEGDARGAQAWLDVVDAAIASPDDPWQIAAEEAALDALVSRTIPSFIDLGDACHRMARWEEEVRPAQVCDCCSLVSPALVRRSARSYCVLDSVCSSRFPGLRL